MIFSYFLCSCTYEKVYFWSAHATKMTASHFQDEKKDSANFSVQYILISLLVD